MSLRFKETSGIRSVQESLNVGPIHDIKYPNQWISEEVLPIFRHIEIYYTALQKTAKILLEAIELGLDLPAGSMLSSTLSDSSELRLNHYPSISKHELCNKNTRRIWPLRDPHPSGTGQRGRTGI